MSKDINWAMLESDLSDVFTGYLKDLVKGPKEDIQGFAQDIAGDMVVALAEDDQSLIFELQDQLLMLAEKHQIDISNVTSEAMGATLNIALKCLSKLVTSVGVLS